jgi:hypothetical protein
MHWDRHTLGPSYIGTVMHGTVMHWDRHTLGPSYIGTVMHWERHALGPSCMGTVMHLALHSRLQRFPFCRHPFQAVSVGHRAAKGKSTQSNALSRTIGLCDRLDRFQ